jgi:hypothetical protein
MIFYSKTSNGFYDSEIHVVLPEDAIEIPVAYHQALIDGQASGLVISSTQDGFPILINAPIQTEEDLLSNKKVEALIYLKETDWYVIRKLEINKEIPQEIIAKRTEAREILSL